MTTLRVYLPKDRQRALARQQEVAERAEGTVLVADISGFTPLSETLVRELGLRTGAEELSQHLNLIYDGLIAQVDKYGGDVISFGGDAITCWFDQDEGSQAVSCAFAMQALLAKLPQIRTPGGTVLPVTFKIAVVSGCVRRFLVGDPQWHYMEVLAGELMYQLAAAEHCAKSGEVVVSLRVYKALEATGQVSVSEWRYCGSDSFLPVAVVSVWQPRYLAQSVVVSADLDKLPLLTDEILRPWVLPGVYERWKAGQARFLTELRPAVALFGRFGGLDYDRDPQARFKLDAYVRWLQSILARYAGTLLQLIIGDKGSFFYAVFGAPITHEDDPERALLAALELRDIPANADFSNWLKAGVQIGVNLGIMRVGDYGGTTRRTYGALGDPVNLAARLMQAAQSDQILVAQPLYEQSHSKFCWATPPQQLTLKGKSAPVWAWELLAVRYQPALFSSNLPDPAAEPVLVGRQTELSWLNKRLNQLLQTRQGELILVSGEAGIGKSRLIAEFARKVEKEGLVRYYGGACQSYGTNIIYLVWQMVWQNFFQLDRTLEPHRQVAQLERELTALDPTLVPRLPLLSAVLNLPIPDNELTQHLEGQLRKTSLEALLVDCLKARANSTPLLLVLEDCQWLDSLSSELLSTLSQALFNLPLLLIVSYRSFEAEEVCPAWPNLPKSPSHLALSNLAVGEVYELVKSKLGPAKVPQNLAEEIAHRTGGNPFYIQELVNYLLDQGLDPAKVGLNLATVSKLPESLHRLILSRLDRLSEVERTLVKIASVFGHAFNLSWLKTLYPVPAEFEQLEQQLAGLVKLQIVALDHKSEIEPQYFFKHIVTQEAVYESMPLALRSNLHEQVGDFLEQHYSQNLEFYVDLLAYHYGRSNQPAKQRVYYYRAAEAARLRYANLTAIDYYQKLLPLLVEAIDQAAELEVGYKLASLMVLVGHWQSARQLYESGLGRAALYPVWQARYRLALGKLLNEQGDPDLAQQLFEQAGQDFQELGDQSGQAQVLREQGEISQLQGDLGLAKELQERSLTLEVQAANKQGIAQTLHNLGTLAFKEGNYQAAQFFYQQSFEIREEIKDRYGIGDVLNAQGNVAFLQGDFKTARTFYEDSLAIMQEVGDKRAQSGTLNNLGNIAYRQGDYPTSFTLYERSLTMRREIGNKGGVAGSLSNLGIVAYYQGDYVQAFDFHQKSLVIRQEIGDKAGIATSLNNLGNVTQQQGRYDLAAGFYTESVRIQREIKDTNHLAYSLANLGVVSYLQGDYSQARSFLTESLAIRRQIGDSWGVSYSAHYLALLAYQEVTSGQALQWLKESWSISWQTRSKILIVNNLILLGWLAKDSARTTDTLNNLARLILLVDHLIETACLRLELPHQNLYTQLTDLLKRNQNEPAGLAAEMLTLTLEQIPDIVSAWLDQLELPLPNQTDYSFQDR